MLYVATLTFHAGLTKEQRDNALARRAEWKYPEGLKVIGEYWPATPPHVISIFEASSYEPIMELMFTWQDVFDFTVSPATTPQEGLVIGAKLLGKK
jgi:hypothetical protein